MMGYTVDEAQRLGMGVDMSLGSGWCFGGPTVSDQDANASVVVKTFDVTAGEKLIGKFNRESTQALVAFSPDGKSVELTDKISADGEVDWTAPAIRGNLDRLRHFAKAVRPESETPRARRRRLDAQPGLSAGHERLAEVVRPPRWPIITAPNRAPSSRIPTNIAPTGRRIFSRNLKNFAATNCKPNCPRFSPTNHASRITHPPRPDHIARVKYDYRRTISEIMARAIRAGVD